MLNSATVNALRRRALVRKGVIAPQAKFLAYDTFTDTNGTALTAHTPNLGGTWSVTFTNAGGLATIQSNQYQPNNNNHGGFILAAMDISFATVSFQLTVTFPSTGGQQGATAFGVLLRYQDQNNYTMVVIDRNNSHFSIYENAAGVMTERASVSFVASLDTPCTIAGYIAGTTVTATVNGGSVITYGTLAVNTSGTKHGIVWRNAATTSLANCDNFQLIMP